MGKLLQDTVKELVRKRELREKDKVVRVILEELDSRERGAALAKKQAAWMERVNACDDTFFQGFRKFWDF